MFALFGRSLIVPTQPVRPPNRALREYGPNKEIVGSASTHQQSIKKNLIVFSVFNTVFASWQFGTASSLRRSKPIQRQEAPTIISCFSPSRSTRALTIMSDELDDLFGAIDGEENGAQPSREKLSTEGSAAKGGNGGDEDVGESDSGNRVSASETRDVGVDAKKIYTSVMSAPTASRLRDEGTVQIAATGADDKAEKKKEAKGEISTGTAHDKSVRSYSSFPKNYQRKKFDKPPKPAKEYPFQLDPFQAQAVEYIDQDESVLVAAHTSAEKTAVAEYAIAKALNNGQRVVYTSPIKVSDRLDVSSTQIGNVYLNKFHFCFLRHLVTKNSETCRKNSVM